MAMTAEALRELHRIHRQLNDLRERQARGPRQVKAREAQLAAAEQVAAQLRSGVKDARVSADKKQLDLKSSENKIVDLRTKLNACSNNKEYQALLDQIAAAEMANSVLADEILEALEQIDELEAKVGEANEKVKSSAGDLEKARQKVKAELEAIEADITRIEIQLKTAEESLPADLRAEYDRVVKSKGEDALAPVEDATCGGCYQHITSNMQNDLALSRIVFCKSCGRLLYEAE